MNNNSLVAFEEFCQKNNMKKTNQRYVVFEAVFHNPTHPTVDDIISAVREKIPMITTESVYRILGDFHKANLISKMPLSSLIRYDCNTDKHSHFVCSKCNKVVDIYDLEVKLPEDIANCKNISFTINALCKECEAAEASVSA